VKQHGKLFRGACALAITAVSFIGCTLVQGMPPVVSYTTPADGSGNAPVGSRISAAFSRAMDPSTITNASFTVSIGDTPVAGAVSCSGTTATFTPSSLLPGDSAVTVTVTTAAKDATGVALGSPRVWTFMTTPTLTAGNIVLYYTYTFNGNPWTRSSTPVSQSAGGNTVSESYNPVDGSITLSVTNAAGMANQDNGFFFSVGSLQNFNSLKVVAAAGSGPFTANLYLDASGDGQFFTWTGNVFNGVGGDLYYTGPASAAGVLTIDATSTFGGHTLAQLRGGSVGGVSGSTAAAIWLGFGAYTLGESQTTTISTVKVN
jgi:Bacterial Ig-like domain